MTTKMIDLGTRPGVKRPLDDITIDAVADAEANDPHPDLAPVRPMLLERRRQRLGARSGTDSETSAEFHGQGHAECAFRAGARASASLTPPSHDD